MITILKHFIYEYAINVIFDNAAKNFMQVNGNSLPNQGDQITITFMDNKTKQRNTLMGDVRAVDLIGIVLLHRANVDIPVGAPTQLTLSVIKPRDIIEWKLIGTNNSIKVLTHNNTRIETIYPTIRNISPKGNTGYLYEEAIKKGS
jgi:hypothetical protein